MAPPWDEHRAAHSNAADSELPGSEHQLFVQVARYGYTPPAESAHKWAAETVDPYRIELRSVIAGDEDLSDETVAGALESTEGIPGGSFTVIGHSETVLCIHRWTPAFAAVGAADELTEALGRWRRGEIIELDDPERRDELLDAYADAIALFPADFVDEPARPHAAVRRELECATTPTPDMAL